MRICQNFSGGTEENNETSLLLFPQRQLVSWVEISAGGPPKYYDHSTTTFGNYVDGELR